MLFTTIKETRMLIVIFIQTKEKNYCVVLKTITGTTQISWICGYK